ncbi:hypothetical protein AVEN_129789-1 [Araneus ventricosus]|uniref:Uncharacterized protein n=1 Tax=Araneus ventricosus TaxID=182803 RepID=A0A4Y2FRU6_ARAVE|nr:hypothetical protein AVEN_129789-1 [Araneus ventricosus]
MLLRYSKCRTTLSFEYCRASCTNNDSSIGNKFPSNEREFRDENVFCLHATAVQGILKSEDIHCNTLLTCSPDLNPIENTWILSKTCCF